MKNTQKVYIKNVAVIFFVSLLFVMAQFLQKSMILGSDSIFHFNRFYDTAKQFDSGNFQYFISLHGFQQSGRAVNVFYGPFFAYIHGLIVHLSSSWFQYQLLSNLLLFCLAGISMFILLSKERINEKLSLAGAIIFMTTYSIQYWTIRQGFSSWGAAVMPLVLLPALSVMKRKKIPVLQLSVFTALLFQIHIFSSLMAIMIYIPCFSFAFVKSVNKGRYILELLLAIALFFLLTINIWLPLLHFYSSNEILAPFVNSAMSSNTVTANSYYWLINPVALLFLILFLAFYSLRHWEKYEMEIKICNLLAVFFIVLTTGLVPWSNLVEKKMALAELIQFPFRFFIPATVLLIFILAYICQNYIEQSLSLRYATRFIIGISV